MFLKQPIEISKNNNLNQFEKPPNSLEQIQNLMLIISSWVTWWFTPGTMEFTPVSTLPIPCYRQIRWGVLTPNHHQISMFHGWIPWTITMKSACFMVESHEQSPWNYHEITMKSPWNHHGLLVNSLPQSPPTTCTPWPSLPAGSARALLLVPPPVVPRAGGSEVSLEARMVGWMVPGVQLVLWKLGELGLWWWNNI